MIIISYCFLLPSAPSAPSAPPIMTYTPTASTKPPTPPEMSMLNDKMNLEKFKSTLLSIKEKFVKNIPLIEEEQRFLQTFSPIAYVATSATKGIIQGKNTKIRSFSFNLINEFPVISNIFEEGVGIFAHGAGTLDNVFNIIIKGTTCSQSYGSLVDGPSAYASGRSGPFYVILDDVAIDRDKGSKELEKFSANPNTKTKNTDISEKYHIAYLVPSAGDKQMLTDLIDRARKINFVNDSDANKLKKKIITYDQLWTVIQNYKQNYKKLKGDGQINGSILKEFL